MAFTARKEGSKRLNIAKDYRLRTMAFSLIEVTLAVSVVSFALLAIIGLLPMGLKSVRDSQDDQVIGTIATQLRAQMQQISFNPTNSAGIASLLTTNCFYSDEGEAIDPTIPSPNIVPYYQATFAVTNVVMGSASPFATNNAVVVQVTLTYPAPAYVQTNAFAIVATSQSGL
jgi:uncharacterized protein (TIGR02598 family)